MKKAFCTILLVTLATLLHAQHYDYQIRFTIQQYNGKTSTGYTCVTLQDLQYDSLKSTDYLKGKLSYRYAENKDSFTYYKHRLIYRYTRPGLTPNDPQTIYHLIKQVTIDPSVIKNIRVLSMDSSRSRFDYAPSIETPLQLSDTAWLKQKPVSIMMVAGYSCDYRILLHENNSEAISIIKQMQAKSKKFYDDNRKSGADLNYEIGDQLADILHKMMEQLNRLKKIVIVAECTG